MGVDTGDGARSDLWSGQSDTMIVMTINPPDQYDNYGFFGTGYVNEHHR